MPDWIPVTSDDLNDSKVAALVDALRTAALASGQTDPSPRVIQSAITEIRRKIASCRSNQLDADEETIPPSLLPLATDMIIARLKGRLEIDLTTDETRQLERHEKTLDRIASCQDVIEQPAAAIDAPTQSAAGTPSITTGRRETLNARRAGL